VRGVYVGYNSHMPTDRSSYRLIGKILIWIGGATSILALLEGGEGPSPSGQDIVLSLTVVTLCAGLILYVYSTASSKEHQKKEGLENALVIAKVVLALALLATFTAFFFVSTFYSRG